MRRILAVLNLVGAVGIVLLMHALYLLAAGKPFQTAEATGVVGGADGPITIYPCSSRPGPGLALATFLLALFLCNAVAMWYMKKSPKEADPND